ncbi:MAG: phosphate ABC transporter permease PstA [Thermoanaerobaculia bacterium]
MRRRTVSRTEALGRSMTWLCGGALALNLLLVVGLIGLMVVNGGAYFWQRGLVQVELDDGRRLLGEVHERGTVRGTEVTDPAELPTRLQLKVGNRDLTGNDFLWVLDESIASTETPAAAMLLERLEWGNFYGFPQELRAGDEVLAQGDRLVPALGRLHAEKVRLREEIKDIEKGAIGDVNFRMERQRLAERKVELDDPPAAEREHRLAEIAERREPLQAEYDALTSRLVELRQQLTRETLVMRAADGTEKAIPVGNIVRYMQPNKMGLWDKTVLYASRVWEFIADDPRESNTEGGIFPAIFGTVMMVFLMSFAVVPLGVLAALYLREYAKQGPLVRMVRIAVNNLAGVPSIVFGVFGLGFFVYFIGGTIDQLFYSEALPTPTYGTGGILWGALTLALLTVPVVIVATEEGLAAVPRIVREGSLALGATKWETTWKVVLPAAAPGILTGMILAMARAAGEVAPLMIVGMVKLAPALPIDGHFPFVHLERKFMHLGFHIFDVGFQSPNVEATKPLVFATALLLILVVTAMNLVAIAIRNHLRRKYAGSAV